MTKKTNKQLFTVLATLLSILNLGMSEQQIQIQVTEKLKQETVRVVQLKSQLQELQRILLIQKKADCVINYYKKAGTLNIWWWINRDYVLEWFSYCDKWKFLAGEVKDVSDMTDFMIGIIHNESNGDKNCKTLEWNKTYSYGITQINDTCIKTIDKELNEKYPELKNKDIKTDVEKNIAGRYLWIKHRKDMGHSWALMNNGWTLYWYLSQVKP